MIELLRSIPDQARRAIYGTYTLAVFIVGGFQVGYAAADMEVPDWTGIALAVLAYIGAAIGVTAAANAGTPPDPVNGDGGDGEVSLLVRVLLLIVLVAFAVWILILIFGHK